MVYLTSADGFVFPAEGLEIPADDFETIGNAFACLIGGSPPLDSIDEFRFIDGRVVPLASAFTSGLLRLVSEATTTMSVHVELNHHAK